MGWIGVILLCILIWVIGSPERQYRKEQMKNYNDFQAGRINQQEYCKRDMDLLFKRHNIK